MADESILMHVLFSSQEFSHSLGQERTWLLSQIKGQGQGYEMIPLKPQGFAFGCGTRFMMTSLTYV